MILSVLTNFLCDDLDEDSNEGSIDQCLIKYLTAADGIFPFCTSFPQVRFFLCQPNLRTKPTWFPRLRPLMWVCIGGLHIKKCYIVIYSFIVCTSINYPDDQLMCTVFQGFGSASRSLDQWDWEPTDGGRRTFERSWCKRQRGAWQSCQRTGSEPLHSQWWV